MPQFKTNGKGFNQTIGLIPSNSDNAPLPLLTFYNCEQFLQKKEAKLVPIQQDKKVFIVMILFE